MPQIEGQEPISYSMAPYTGPWTTQEAAHLLRRALFGPTIAQINTAVSDGMATTVSNVLTSPPIGDPITYSTDDPNSAIGSSWVNSVYSADPAVVTNQSMLRYVSLAVWLVERINSNNDSIAEKMCLFWQNHFGLTSTADAKAGYQYFKLLHNSALGNFKQLIKDVTVEPSMLIFLNGASNNQFDPNENYSRELLELYTIGKGPQIAEGDYTNYTEQDVSEGAKILTGFYPDDLASSTSPVVTSNFNAILHDSSTKTLSDKFGGATISNNGQNEYQDYIDIIFQQDEVAKHICRKLYRWFVNYDLTVTVESTVIDEMAATMIANNYDVVPVLQELLTSEHFYDISVRGAQIKSPLDMVFSIFNSTETTNPGFDVTTNAEMYASIYEYCSNIGQAYIAPPSVAGWPAYYQEPAYSQLWINATYLKGRFQVTDYMCFLGLTSGANNWRLNVIEFLNNLTDPTNAVQIIDDMILLFTPKGASAQEKLILKGILTNGQPDFEWTIQYNEYVADPGNPATYGPIRTRLELVLARLFHLPQFQTF